MNFGRILKADCVNLPLPPDARCADDAFRIANPDVCPAAPQLILKPAIALVCPLGSVQFRAFLIQNSRETDVTDQTTFKSADNDIALVGAGSGNATGLAPGVDTISASYQDKTAFAQLTVLATGNSCGCCATRTVAMMILLDNSRSMSQVFSPNYSTKLTYAKAAAKRFIGEVNEQKDLIGLLVFNETAGTVLSSPIADKAAVAVLVNPITQTQKLTEFYDPLAAALSELAAVTADEKVLLLISDGEDQTQSYLSNNPITLLSDFKAQGGIVLCLGVRTHDRGYNLLETFSTGGFFLNAYQATEQTSLDYLSGLKGYICAGNCTPTGDVILNRGALNYTRFLHWNVLGGTVDLQGNGFFDYLPGNGLYVDMAGTNASQKGKLQSNAVFSLLAGNEYRIAVDLAGNQREDLTPDSVRIRLFYLDNNNNPAYLLDQKVSINDFKQPFQTYAYTFTAPASVAAYISIQQEEQPDGGDPRIGLFLGRVQLKDVTTQETLLDDDFDDENPQYVPPRCGAGTLYHYMGSGSGTQNVNMVPLMTSNLTPSGECFGSDFVAGDWFKAFDRDNATSLTTNPGTGDFFVQYKFTTETTITSYKVKIHESGNYGSDPFKLQGSNNGSTWTDLDSHTPDGTLQSFTLSTAATYLYFRVLVTTASYQFFGVDFYTLELWGVIGTPTYGYSSGYCCYGVGCLDSPPAAQLEDPTQLPDIESGFTPPTTYSSTKQACASCPTGSTNANNTSLVPVLTGNTGTGVTVSASSAFTGSAAWNAFDGYKTPDAGNPPVWTYQSNAAACWLQVQFAAAPTINSYKIYSYGGGNYEPKDWTFQGSNNGSTWTDLDKQTGISWFQNEAKQFQFSNATAYLYYRLNVTANHGQTRTIIAELELYGAVATQVCKTATAESTVSQADADNQAYAAALALAQAALNCQTVYTSTEQYTASCPAGEFGQSITKSATRTSLVSQAEADAAALAAAKADAEAALDCTLSNNDQTIVINDRTGANSAPASPYPSVKYVSGLAGLITKVTLTLKGLSHTYPDDINIILMHTAPNGTQTIALLMANCGGGFPVNNLDITFDDAAGAPMPDNAQLVAGSYQCSSYPVPAAFPAPAPSTPYSANLAAFNGADPNGHWSVWVIDDAALNSGQILHGFTVQVTSA